MSPTVDIRDFPAKVISVEAEQQNGLVERQLSGWGNLSTAKCHVATPRSVAELNSAFARKDAESWIARGLGRSYGDAALNSGSGVIVCDRLVDVLDFDCEQGMVRCEAGVSVGQLVNRLVPQGWFLPVSPGTRFVTLGGAVAADVHGKNHHVDGSIGRHVTELELLTPTGEIRCGPDKESDVFWATVGGMGLTGLIRRVTLRLRPIETAFVAVDYEKAGNLDATLERLDATRDNYRYSIVWIDCLASGKRLGRGVLMQGNVATLADLPASLADDPRRMSRNHTRSLPFNLPSVTLNRVSVGILNRSFYAIHPTGRRIETLERFFYPLDTVLHWNRMYGRRGFIQYQAVFPKESSREGMIRLLECMQRRGIGSFFAGLKIAGEENPGLLSFMRPGHTIALDLPWRRGLRDLVHAMDRIVVDHGGRIYLAKDAMMGPETFRAGYPRLAEFRRIRRRLDPDGLLRSDLARRLKILDD